MMCVSLSYDIFNVFINFFNTQLINIVSKADNRRF